MTRDLVVMARASALASAGLLAIVWSLSVLVGG